MAEINVTPMVDVGCSCSSSSSWSPRRSSPSACRRAPEDRRQSAADRAGGAAHHHALTREGKILIQNTEVPRDAFIAKLRAVAAERSGDKVFLRADGAIPLFRRDAGDGALNASGFNNVGLSPNRAARGSRAGQDAKPAHPPLAPLAPDLKAGIGRP